MVEDTVQLLQGVVQFSSTLAEQVQNVRSLLDSETKIEPLTMPKSAALFSLFSQVKDNLDTAIRAIQEETCPPARNREPGRLQRLLCDFFVNEATQKMSVHGRTIYLHSLTTASLGMPKATELLKANADTEFLVKDNVNAQSLAAWVRELPKDESGDPILPDDLKEAVRVTTIVQVRAVKS